LLVRFWQGFVGAVVALFVAAAITLGTLSLVNSGEQVVIACRQVNVLRAALVRVLQQGENDLPHNKYLQAHPDQLKQAVADYRVDIAKLSPVAC